MGTSRHDQKDSRSSQIRASTLSSNRGASSARVTASARPDIIQKIRDRLKLGRRRFPATREQEFRKSLLLTEIPVWKLVTFCCYVFAYGVEMADELFDSRMTEVSFYLTPPSRPRNIEIERINRK
ncbi:hypothetical protein CEXT_499761 [Caerostris extrusa]|uniref:Uncharacterized protein n=1 Tax=Caerostris extrusa TaxID=172846 RepID=A0AAV4MX14_CAEEX|nr:hypothetical protein CEXT_499761 [Caerostris extrusa]